MRTRPVPLVVLALALPFAVVAHPGCGSSTTPPEVSAAGVTSNSISTVASTGTGGAGGMKGTGGTSTTSIASSSSGMAGAAGAGGAGGCMCPPSPMMGITSSTPCGNGVCVGATLWVCTDLMTYSPGQFMCSVDAGSEQF